MSVFRLADEVYFYIVNFLFRKILCAQGIYFLSKGSF